MKIQYQIEHLIDDDLLSCEIEFTEKQAIETAKEMLDNTGKGNYCLISKLEQEDNGSYSTIEQDYISIWTKNA